MSTRALYFFKDTFTPKYFVVYKHHDGYPSGAVEWICTARDSGRAWELPRWEGSDFAAAFVAANKHGPGGVYFYGEGHPLTFAEVGDEYRYVISKDDDGKVWVEGFTVPWTGSDDVEHPATPVLKRTELSELSADAIIEEDED
jgi:hypothetical protein